MFLHQEMFFQDIFIAGILQRCFQCLSFRILRETILLSKEHIVPDTFAILHESSFHVITSAAFVEISKYNILLEHPTISFLS